MHDAISAETWIEISASAHRHNLEFFRRQVGADIELSSVVKSNAYGHGLTTIAKLASRSEADSFCVHALDEALDLRAAGLDQDILIMGHVPALRLAEVVEHDLRVAVYDLETVDGLATAAGSQGKRARAHLKIETGTYRQGLAGDELDLLLTHLAIRPEVVVEGAYTHFADIEDTMDHGYARQQLKRYQAALEQIEQAGFAPTVRHTACSAAAMLFPSTHFDMVRLGIGQYGLWSSRETRLTYRHHDDDHDGNNKNNGNSELRPVLTWKTRISQVKWVPADATVGYGRSYRTTRRTRLAVLPIGYSDGYDRRLSGTSRVLVRGRTAPLLGRVCMNLVMIDVTDVPGVESGDEVVLIGRQGEREVTADQLAQWSGTINYEVVTRIAPHIPRLVVD